MKTFLTLITLLLPAVTVVAEEEKWHSLFDGKSLEGWKASKEKPESFSVVDGTLKVSGGRAHLFYAGDVNGGTFRDFEFKAKVMTKKNANSGIYFHTAWQESGWPSKGYECQVNNTHSDRRKTASLYAIKDVLDDAPAKDDEWFDYHIRVEGKRIIIKINGEVQVDFTEPDEPSPPKGMEGRLLGTGTFAIQAHDPKSTIYYKDIFVRPL